MARRGQYDLDFDLRNEGVCSDRPLKVHLGDFLLQMTLKQQNLVFFQQKMVESIVQHVYIHLVIS